MTIIDAGSYETLDAATQAALDALETRLNRPTSWKPENKGERCTGKATASPWETVEPYKDKKKRCEVLTLITAAGPMTIWAYQKQLKTKLIKPGISKQAEAEAVPYSERLVQPGDLVVIEYAGELPHPFEEGQTYKRFIVEISRPVVGEHDRGSQLGPDDDLPI